MHGSLHAIDPRVSQLVLLVCPAIRDGHIGVTWRSGQKNLVGFRVDCGDNVIVINAEKINLTGNKWEDKTYLSHTGYPGGQRFTGVKQLLEKHPERIIEKAVKGMLPKTKLGAAVLRNLKVYAGSEHKQEAQQPVTINLNDLK